MANLDEPQKQNNPFGEWGVTGLNQWNGLVSEAYRKELRWPAAYSTLSQMQRRNPTIASLLNAERLLARTASWDVEPAGSSPADQAAADFLGQCLDDLETGIRDAAEDLLSGIPYGWAWSELVYKRRQGPNGERSSHYADDRIGWADWAPRRQSSFYSWDFDDHGKLRGFIQTDPATFQQITIPFTKSLHYVAQRDMGNPEGLSILEPAYEPWFFMQNLAILSGIGFERSFSGLPVFHYGTPEAPYTPSEADKSLVSKAGKGLRVDEKAYVALPGQIGFELVTTTNTNADSLLNQIKYYAIAILQIVLADFIALGTTSTGGSYALGQDKSELFLMAVDGWLDQIAHPDDLGILNRYAVPRLFAYNNFQGITDYPRIKHTSVQRPNLPSLAQYLSQLTAFIHPDAILEADLRKKANLPEAESATEPQPGAPGSGSPEETKPETGTQAPAPSNGTEPAPHPPALGKKYFQLALEFEDAAAEFKRALGK